MYRNGFNGAIFCQSLEIGAWAERGPVTERSPKRINVRFLFTVLPGLGDGTQVVVKTDT